MSSLPSPGPDPNQLKNRIPTVKEEEILRRSIRREEQKLDELDAEISNLEKEATEYQEDLRDRKLVLQAAETLCLNCEKISSFLNELSGKIVNEVAMNGTDQSTILHRQQVNSIENDLEKAHNSYLQHIQLAIEGARREYRSIEEEVDSTGSLLHRITHSVDSRIELRKQLCENIRQMKDLIGPRRRVPNELWSKIFWERVTEDEEDYGRTWRDDSTPYTTLKLTWVCRLWRQIVTNEPSLWRYIPVPETLYIPEIQADKIRYFKERLKIQSPSIYMIPGEQSSSVDDTHLKDLLSGIPSITLLELQVTTQFSSIVSFLSESESKIETLCLVNSNTGETRDTGTYLPLQVLKKVKHLSCYNIRPRIDRGDSQGEPNELHSLFLQSHAIDNKDLVLFLENSGSKELEFNPVKEFRMTTGNAIDQDTTLIRLRRINAPLGVITSLFNSHVSLPNLKYLQVKDLSELSVVDALQNWTAFFASHDRKDRVTSLSLVGLPQTDSPPEAVNMFKAFIGQVPNLTCLTLNKGCVVPTLRGMTEARNVPNGLVELNIHTSEDVTEGDVNSLLQTLSTEQRGLLSLGITGCPLISEDAKERLDCACQTPEEKEDSTGLLEVPRQDDQNQVDVN